MDLDVLAVVLLMGLLWANMPGDEGEIRGSSWKEELGRSKRWEGRMWAAEEEEAEAECGILGVYVCERASVCCGGNE